MCIDIGEMILTAESRSTWREIYSGATLYTTNPTCSCLGSNAHLVVTVHRSTHFDLFRLVMTMCYTCFCYVYFEKILDESENFCRVSHHIYLYSEKPLAPRPIPNTKSSVISRPSLFIQRMQFARADNLTCRGAYCNSDPILT
jgi:hypothetical protein